MENEEEVAQHNYFAARASSGVEPGGVPPPSHIPSKAALAALAGLTTLASLAS